MGHFWLQNRFVVFPKELLKTRNVISLMLLGCLAGRILIQKIVSMYVQKDNVQ